MKRTLLITALLAGVATAAAAGSGCNKGHGKQAVSCADGSVWDAQSQSCVSKITS